LSIIRLPIALDGALTKPPRNGAVDRSVMYDSKDGLVGGWVFSGEKWVGGAWSGKSCESRFLRPPGGLSGTRDVNFEGKTSVRFPESFRFPQIRHNIKPKTNRRRKPAIAPTMTPISRPLLLVL
jgi:hypothetical protein